MKYIIVTGGVISGLGEGITASSIGRLLKSRGLNVTEIKIDPCSNFDSGTLNPFNRPEISPHHIPPGNSLGGIASTKEISSGATDLIFSIEAEIRKIFGKRKIGKKGFQEGVIALLMNALILNIMSAVQQAAMEPLPLQALSSLASSSCL